MSKDGKQALNVGDRIRIVSTMMSMGEYRNGDEGEVTSLSDKGVMVFFDHYEEGEGSMYVLEGEYEVIEKDALTSSAESLRNFILDIRSKRDALYKELLQLDEQEKKAVEKLKEQGFILYEENVSKEVVAATTKAVLYAEDIEEDMTNPENWKVGDLFVRCEGDGTDQFRVGEVVRLTDKSETSYCRYEYLDGRDYWHVKSVNVKFHSRPVE